MAVGPTNGFGEIAVVSRLTDAGYERRVAGSSYVSSAGR